VLADIDFIKYGHINSYQTSPIFGLGQARSQEAESAINTAKQIQLKDNPSKEEISAIHELLLNSLAESDPFWPRWVFFAENHGVKI
jgi:hypothetical protein